MSNPRCSPVGLLVALAVLSAAGPAAAENVDPDADDSQYAWSENAGWLNAEPSGNGGPGVQVGDFELSGYLWGENIGWVGLSCQNTASCATTPYGVVNDGTGMLSGYAWSENAGWISLSCENTSTCSAVSYGVTINATTGELGGYAWAENLGWISMSCANTASCGTADYGIKTDWCQSVSAAPPGTPDLSAAKNGRNLELSWSVLVGAGWYEIVRGSLSALRSSTGDYSVATEQCIVDNETGTMALYAAVPPVGDGFWFLVRGANCKGKGTYESGGAGQSGLRDPEIAASGNDCD